MRLCPRYRTLIDKRHIEAMFALIENEQEFLRLFNYLTGNENTLLEFIAILLDVKTFAITQIMTLSIEDRAYINAVNYIFEKGALLKQEDQKGAYIASLFKESDKLADLLIEAVRKNNIDHLTDHL